MPPAKRARRAGATGPGRSHHLDGSQAQAPHAGSTKDPTDADRLCVASNNAAAASNNGDTNGDNSAVSSSPDSSRRRRGAEATQQLAATSPALASAAAVGAASRGGVPGRVGDTFSNSEAEAFEDDPPLPAGRARRPRVGSRQHTTGDGDDTDEEDAEHHAPRGRGFGESWCPPAASVLAASSSTALAASARGSIVQSSSAAAPASAAANGQGNNARFRPEHFEADEASEDEQRPGEAGGARQNVSWHVDILTQMVDVMLREHPNIVNTGGERPLMLTAADWTAGGKALKTAANKKLAAYLIDFANTKLEPHWRKFHSVMVGRSESQRAAVLQNAMTHRINPIYLDHAEVIRQFSSDCPFDDRLTYYQNVNKLSQILRDESTLLAELLQRAERLDRATPALLKLIFLLKRRTAELRHIVTAEDIVVRAQAQTAGANQRRATAVQHGGAGAQPRRAIGAGHEGAFPGQRGVRTDDSAQARGDEQEAESTLVDDSQQNHNEDAELAAEEEDGAQRNGRLTLAAEPERRDRRADRDNHFGRAGRNVEVDVGADIDIERRLVALLEAAVQQRRPLASETDIVERMRLENDRLRQLEELERRGIPVPPRCRVSFLEPLRGAASPAVSDLSPVVPSSAHVASS